MGHTALIHLIQRKNSIFGWRTLIDRATFFPEDLSLCLSIPVPVQREYLQWGRCQGPSGHIRDGGGEARYIYGYPFSIRQLE